MAFWEVKRWLDHEVSSLMDYWLDTFIPEWDMVMALFPVVQHLEKEMGIGNYIVSLTPFCFSAFWLPWDNWICSTHDPSTCHPQAHSSGGSVGWNLKSWAKISSLLLHSLSQAFCHSDVKLTNTSRPRTEITPELRAIENQSADIINVIIVSFPDWLEVSWYQVHPTRDESSLERTLLLTPYK